MDHKQPTIAFDVDGTLIDFNDKPKYDMVLLFRVLSDLGCEMYIWSGTGKDWAEEWAFKLGLKAKIVEKCSFKPDITFDDMAHRSDFDLGTINICV